MFSYGQMIQSREVFSGFITCSSILHKLGLGIAFVISMLILPLPPPSSSPCPFTYYIPVLFLSPALLTIFSIPYFFPVFPSSCSPFTFFLPLFYPSPSRAPSCPGDSIISALQAAINCTSGASWSWR